MKTLPEFPLPVDTGTHVLQLDALPPRIVRMVETLLRHQAVLCAYETGAITLHYNGPEVKPQLEKVALNSGHHPHT
jgi:hypothetical protein